MQDTLFTSTTLYSALAEIALRTPSASAIVYEGQTIQYKELIDRIDVVADYLNSLGLRQGHSIAAFGQNSPDFAIHYYAAAKLGVVFVPLNFNLTPAEIAYILNHCEAKFLFLDEDATALMIDSSETAMFRSQFRPLRMPVRSEWGVNLIAPSVPEAEHDLIIAYTSGTTGTPKAVVMDHTAQLGAAKALKDFWGLNGNDCTVVAAPLGFLLGLSTATTVGLLNGMKVVIHRRFHPVEVLDSMVKHEVTVYTGVPTMYSMMLEHSEQQDIRYDLSKVRSLICCGAPLADELKKRFEIRFGQKLQNYYGMTECYPLIGKFANDPNPHPETCVGRIAPNASIKIVAADGKECEPGVAGEMLVKAASMLKRYHKDHALTQASLVDGWFKSGDLGSIDAHGHVYITGRIKDIIIRGGANISPVEIESVLQRHPDVQDAAVIGVPDERYGEVPVAFIKSRQGRKALESSLIQHCTVALAKFKVPASIIVCDVLPLGTTGKVDKQALKKQWSTHTISVAMS
ncbi:class I adenylate-forming enzyme family protein [Pseudomonas sp. A-R-19]|uniref:class I adenylate-forming enzyme family protein n=1 Tax=Pseudomonas sp. A-R-19 TaxID=2832403 RepID=UPI001CC1AD15|nr:AMP-binding protein [Pseudomonas sp. A-R-19]